jgi:hypothetical protein
MTDTDHQPGKLTDHRDRRFYVWWGVVLGFLLLLALFGQYLVRPYFEVGAAVGRISFGGTKRPDNIKDEVSTLGGPERAAKKCSLFIRCPKWLATEDEKTRAFWIMGACDQPGFPWAEKLLRSSDKDVRAGAAMALGDTGDLRGVTLLMGALKDPSRETRSRAAWSLGKLKDPRAVEPLVSTLEDSDSEVGMAAEAALINLVKLKAPSSVEPLVGALKNPRDVVRVCASRLLWLLEDPRSVEPLIGALKDPHCLVRLNAAGTLGTLKDPRAIGPLKELSSDPDEIVRSAAQEAIKKIEAAGRPDK